jgi:hypothetical protein
MLVVSALIGAKPGPAETIVLVQRIAWQVTGAVPPP